MFYDGRIERVDMKLSNGKWAAVIIFAVLLIDQIVKIWIKTHFYLGEGYRVTDWFYIAFIENNGMAFGMEFGSKLFLTIFRILAVVLFCYYLVKIKDRPGVRRGFIVCVALVIAGAAGNIIDCLFYGLIFNNPVPPEVATLFPAGGGYAPLFYGKVVDMLYFPLFSFYWPDWLPWIGGTRFEFFRPVFNIADSAITVAMICIILFYNKDLSETLNKKTLRTADTEEK